MKKDFKNVYLFNHTKNVPINLINYHQLIETTESNWEPVKENIAEILASVNPELKYFEDKVNKV